MDERNIKINVTRTYVRSGNYEGHDYYHLIAETAEGFTLKTKLTKFEYEVVKDNYAIAG